MSTLPALRSERSSSISDSRLLALASAGSDARAPASSTAANVRTKDLVMIRLLVSVGEDAREKDLKQREILTGESGTFKPMCAGAPGWLENPLSSTMPKSFAPHTEGLWGAP